MVKSELLLVLSKKRPNLTLHQVDSAINCILSQIELALTQGKHIEVRGFGCFDLRHHAPRKARNPKTGESIVSPARISIHFKPGKDMKDRINATHHQSVMKS